ncbi:MAG: TonB-dependent receptor [Acidobacteria bacterium]|nr:TonB-dependent receptor [Acidobacteriota bacterium]
MKKTLVAKLAIFVLLASVASALAQATGSLKGQVQDPNGAVIPGASITLKSAAGQVIAATSNDQGSYEVKGLMPGAYTVTVTAEGFSPFEAAGVQVAAGKPTALNVPLQIQVQQQQVMVDAESPTVSTASESNASTVIIKGKDLEALSDDPDELQSELEALAGPAAGPNGGQIYIDGFTGGQLPPKASIREIRVNSNPFSPEFDRLGYGRIEILTKPGTDQFHGSGYFNISDSALNSKNPFVTTIPSYQTDQYSGNIGGPITKKSSFFFNVEHRNIGEAAVFNARVIDQNFNQVPFTGGVANPRVRTNLSPRIDWQLTDKDTLTFRYQYEWSHDTNDGLGSFSLPSLAYNSTQNEHQIQISESHIFSANLVNDLRFRFEREFQGQTPGACAPVAGYALPCITSPLLPNAVTISVPGAFSFGGNSSGMTSDLQNNNELQNYTQYMHGNHSIKFGGRLRVIGIDNSSLSGQNGSFAFPSLTAYQVMQKMLAQDANCTAAPSSAACWQDIHAANAGPSQFRIVTGQPAISLTYADAGLYASDDWKFRPNITVSYGLRFETQNYIHDHGDFAPRVAIAWGVGSSKGSPKTVIRAGSGVFYDRFNSGGIENTLRYNGTLEQQYILSNPAFFSVIPSINTLAAQPGSAFTTYQEAASLRAPYIIQSAVAVERQLTKVSTLSVTYLNSRGTHQFFADNVNAAEPGTYNYQGCLASPGSAACGVHPLGNSNNVYQYISEGIFKQNQLIVSATYRAGARLSFNTFYTLSSAHSNSNGVNSFPVDPYNVALDYGRAAFDVRHRFMVMGTAQGPWGFRVSPFVVFNSGAPYNITLGQDLIGSSILNQRPGFANTAAPAVVWTASNPCPIGTQNCVTPLGAFNLSPGVTPIPLYIGSGPNNFTFNMRLSKVFGFGPERGRNGNNQNRGGGAPGGGGDHGAPGGGGRGGLGPGGLGGGGMRGMMGPGAGGTNRRYNLTLSVNARNLFNNVNFVPPVGNLGSPLFGTANTIAGGGGFGPGGSAANRRLDFQAQFSF